jgi:DNA-binding PadR family transcriptional regulator
MPPDDGSGLFDNKRGRARHGEVRAAVLVLLAERPMHGYEIMQELAQRTGGGWRPSQGTVYPALSSLKQEGLITDTGDGARRTFNLTDAGRAEAEEQAGQGEPPWQRLAEQADTEEARLQDAFHRTGQAFAQVIRVGSADQKAKALQAVNDLRRGLYLILAEGDDE